MGSATLMSERISTETSSFPEVPPFTRVSQTDSRRKSMPCAHNQVWSRSSPQLTDTTPCGLVAPHSALSPLSSPNGLPRKTTLTPVLRSSTENAYERQDYSQTVRRRAA